MAVSVSVWSDVLLLNVGQSMSTFQSPPPSWLWSKHSRRAAFRKRCRVVGARSLGSSLALKSDSPERLLPFTTWTSPLPWSPPPSSWMAHGWTYWSEALDVLHWVKPAESNQIESNDIKSKRIQFNQFDSNQNALKDPSLPLLRSYRVHANTPEALCFWMHVF